MEDLPMSLKPKELSDIPEETRRVAARAFPKGNIYVKSGVKVRVNPV